MGGQSYRKKMRIFKMLSSHLPLNASWQDLHSIFNDKQLSSFFEGLEKKYDVIDESDFFSSLVNMSKAGKMPFHRWIRYREGYSGELVKEILLRYPIDSKKEYVMDPMCGSGSSLVAGKQLSIDVLGLDVNAYAVLATNVKCSSYSSTDLKKIQSYINDFKYIKDSNIDHTLSICDLEKYFPANNLSVVCNIHNWILSTIEDKKYRDFFLLSLFAILEDCSDRKKDGNGLATRPSPVSDPISRMSEQLDMMFSDISIQQYYNVKCIALDHSALELSQAAVKMTAITDKSLGSIIFSPPYANSFDYFESYKLELIFGGYTTSKKIKEDKLRLIRNYRISKPIATKNKLDCVENICEEILLRVPEKEAETGVKDSRTRLVPNMLRGYFDDMATVISQAYNSLNHNGMMHIVVDQSAYVGVPIPTDLILAHIAENVGFNVAGIINCRRANTSGQQLKKYPYLKSLLRESIVSLCKK